MPIDLSWYIPKRVVRVHVYGEAGVPEIKQMMLDASPYFAEGIAPIHILLDDSTAQPPPISLKQIKAALGLQKHASEKLGWVMGVGDVNVIAKVVIPMLTKVIGIKYLRVNGMDEAITFLRKQDMSLQATDDAHQQS